MKVSVLSFADDDNISGVLGVFANPGLVIEYFVETFGLSQEEKKDIARKIAISFRESNNQRAYFCHDCTYCISEFTVKQ